MGLLNFMKNAGKTLFGGDEDAAPEPKALEKELADLGLEAEGVGIAVDGDTVKLSGKAPSQEVKEKLILAVGNVAGVAAVDDATEGAPPVLHEVKQGDTLWAIAKRTLGDGARYAEIFEANKPMLDDPDKIYPGQMLRIPQDG